MKILLDENLPIKLKSSIASKHDVLTVHEMNWSGTKNGKLLELLKSNNFEVFITGDKNLKYQHNLSNYSLTIIILNSTSLHINKLFILMKKANRIIEEGPGLGLIEVKE